MLHTARPTIVYLLIPMFLLLFMPTPGSSSDAQGNYVALGFGLESCQTFLQARSNSLDLPYRHWLIGISQGEGIGMGGEGWAMTRVRMWPASTC